MIEIKSDKEITSCNLAIIIFSAEWCEPCKKLKPALQTLSKDTKYKHIKFCKIDYEAHKEIADKYNISCLPTTIFVKNGIVQKTITGASLADIKLSLDKFR